MVCEVAQFGVDRVGAASLPLAATSKSGLSSLRRNCRSHLGGLRSRGGPGCRNDFHDLRAADSRGEALLDGLHHLFDRLMGFGVDLVQVLAQPIDQACALLAHSRERKVTIRLRRVDAGIVVHLVDEAVDHVARLLRCNLIARLAATVSIRKKIDTLSVLSVSSRLEVLWIRKRPNATKNRC
ncbi:hypothetical protein LTT02_20905 [Mycolicibacterium smegmatis]|uniref:hypothetical protein n=1 Tax=Mycolicibacterium smegmatis TaxID=1772 RepID=UPI001CBC9079|nr:hypothetical protein [Mycolicibacterium smegmatis]MDF1903739.1 hypothetical protein [Mycolicibacterium smegmatis]MDF1910306.1 hypothetical protein [Mycolicibacterium smegmatis]MDF1922076.1 hypothetical protein [Mycolicibacterium smegmatis]MDF1928630.1 hypothetical protein [Mycolicibacterium smegmatis]UGT73253.1 hypothetical protein LTT02_20905 [Mycolicibacterium smegmatis]